jgi:hypothetical protein
MILTTIDVVGTFTWRASDGTGNASVGDITDLHQQQ